MKKLFVKDWFVSKNFNSNEAYVINNANLRVERETEKAFYIAAESDYGTLRFWAPKSCTYEADEREVYTPAWVKKDNDAQDEKYKEYREAEKEVFTIGQKVNTKAFGICDVKKISSDNMNITLNTNQGIKNIVNNAKFIWSI